jgi:hypothetical protein
VFLEVIASSFDVVSTGAGLAGIPGWLRAHYVAAVDAALPRRTRPCCSACARSSPGIPPTSTTRSSPLVSSTCWCQWTEGRGVRAHRSGSAKAGARSPCRGPAIGLIGLYALAGGATPTARAAIMGGLGSRRPTAASHVDLARASPARTAWHRSWRDVGFQPFAGTARSSFLRQASSDACPVPAILREPFGRVRRADRNSSR